MAGYSGDGSYQRLIVNIYGARNGNVTQNYKEYNNNTEIRPDDTLIQSALSFVRSGYLGNNNDGAPHTRNSYGNFWENVIRTNTIGIYYLNFLSIRLNTQHIGNKGNGYSVRCVAKSYFPLDFFAYL